jgi:hypothetical protein
MPFLSDPKAPLQDAPPDQRNSLEVGSSAPAWGNQVLSAQTATPRGLASKKPGTVDPPPNPPPVRVQMQDQQCTKDADSSSTLNQCFQDPTRSGQTTLLPNTKLYMANGWGAGIYMAYADIHCRMELASFLFGLGELAS